MHRTVKRELIKWYLSNKEYLDATTVADIGAYNINGSVKEVISNSIGFDIFDGEGVDVVIYPGTIPDEHKFKYGAVTTVSSFQFCPDSELYKKQILDLLCDGGLLFLTMCNDKCNGEHTTSPNGYDFKDSVRYSLDELTNLFSKEFDVIDLYEVNKEHNDLILKAKKK